MKTLFAFALWLRPGLTLALAMMTGLPTQAQSRYTVLANGQEVSDAQTGLTWRRCAEGMVFNGSTCTGSATSFRHEAALAHARDQAGWRMPNVKELHTLVDKSRISPSIDINAFPATPRAVFWASTPYSASGMSWYVDFRGGYVDKQVRALMFAVRLVRTSQ